MGYAMRIEFAGLITIFAGLVILTAPVSRSFIAMVLSTVFGAAAAISLPALGGASVLVPSLFLLFFGVRLFMAFGEGPIIASLRLGGPGFWLLILTAFGLLSAFSFPKLFEGVTETMIVERIANSRSFISLMPLHFTSNNITQSFYALGGLAAFAGAFAYFREAGTPQHFVNAMIAVAVLDLSFALVDVITYFTHTEYVLSFVRTANYALLTDAEKGGFKRISGAFPEASAFSSYTIVLLATISSLWLDHIRPRTTGLLSAALLVALVFSTSATALVSIAVILPLLWLRALSIALRDPPRGRPVWIVASVALVPVVALTIIVLFPGVSHGIGNFLNEMLLSKASSQSGHERLLWNATAFQTFLDTSGLGAGLGSARASSFVLVLLSNLGVIGFFLFAIFAVTIIVTHVRPQDGAAMHEVESAARAAKFGFLAVLASASISGAVYDLGLMFYLLAGSAAALAAPHSARISGRVSEATQSTFFPQQARTLKERA